MKTNFLLLKLFLICICSSIYAQDTVINDFDTVSPTVSAQYGSTFSIVANPNSNGNTTASCARLGRTSGNWYELMSFPTSFSVPANTTQYLHILVNYAAQPDAGIRVDGNTIIRSSNSYTNFGGWQDLVFAINGGASGISVTELMYHADLGFNNSPAGQILNNTDKFGYIDEIIFNSSATPRSLTVFNPILSDFETISPTVTTNYGSTFSVVANPNTTGNTSASCGQIGRTSANWYELVSFPTSFSVAANTTKYLHLMVNYPTQPDIAIRVDATSENPDGTTPIRPFNTYTNVGGWQDLVFVINGGTSGINVNSIVINTDLGFENASASQVLNNTDQFGYIDEILLNGSSVPRPIVAENPIKNNFETISPAVTTNYGATFSVVANPNTTGNTSSTCGQIGRTTTNFYELVTFPSTFSVVENTTKYLHIMVNYPVQPDIAIRVDATSTNPDGSVDIRPLNSYTNIGGWQDLVFAVNGGVSGINVSSIVILADVGAENTSLSQVLNNTDQFGYIDEIIFNENASPRDIVVENPIKNNFETISPTVSSNYGATFSVVANPDTNGNTSASCGKIGRTTSNWYELVSFPTTSFVPANTTKYLHMMVNYTAQPDIALRVDGTAGNPDGTVTIRPLNSYSNIGGWQDLVFAINGGNLGINISSIVIFTDIGFENSSASQVLNNTNQFGYIDEIILNESAAARALFPENPIKNNFESISPTVSTKYGATFSVVANPDTNGNTSASCGQIGRTTTNFYELVSFPSTFSVPANTTKYLHVMVNYPSQPDITVRFDATIANPDGSVDIRPLNSYTNSGGWQDLVFALNGGASGINVSSIVILSDVGAENTSGTQVLNNTNQFAYIDEIILDDNSLSRFQIWYQDFDGDTYGNALVSQSSLSQPVGYVSNNTDCNDTNNTVYPGATELYNFIDDDCDGLVDEDAALPSSLTFCKGATVATAKGTTDLQLYTSTSPTALPLTGTTALSSKVYYATLNGSARTAVTVTVNLLPSTPASMATTDAVLCKHIGTTNAVTYSVPVPVLPAVAVASYSWTLPSGVTATSATNTNSITVNFLGASTSTAVGGIGTISARAISAAGCLSAPRSLILTSKLPTSPTSLTLTSADTNANFNSGIPAVPTSLSQLAKITKVGAYMGTGIVFTLTAPVAPTAASYAWTLPAGVNQLSGGTSNVITVDFAGVLPGTGLLPISVRSVGGCGQSVTPRTLSLARALPTAPTALILTDDAISSTTPVAKVGAYTGKTTQLTLTATPARVQGATATSYAWILPSGVNIVSPAETTDVTIQQSVNTGTFTPEGAPIFQIQNFTAKSTGTASTITVNFAGVAQGTLTFPLSVFAVNGTGNSKARTRTVTAAAPTSPAITAVGGTTFNSCTTKTYSVVQTLGTSYAWTIPAGATASSLTGNTIVVDYTNVVAVVGATAQVTCVASNGTGSSLPKVLNVKRVLCPVRLADSSANDFSVKAYPNPSSSEFTIETSGKGAMNVKVYDMQGRLVEKSNTERVGSKLAAGTYNVIVNQGAKTKSVRVIKK